MPTRVELQRNTNTNPGTWGPVDSEEEEEKKERDKKERVNRRCHIAVAAVFVGVVKVAITPVAVGVVFFLNGEFELHYSHRFILPEMRSAMYSATLVILTSKVLTPPSR